MTDKPPAKPIGDMDIGELIEELANCEVELVDARGKAAAASAAETAALNAVNHVQKAIDIRLAECRRDAMRGTDWNMANTRTSGVSA